MMTVSVREAKVDFSKLMRLIESKREDEIQITRNGRSIVKMTLVNDTPVSRRIGIAEGKFEVPDDLDAGSEDIAAMFTGGDLF